MPPNVCPTSLVVPLPLLINSPSWSPSPSDLMLVEDSSCLHLMSELLLIVSIQIPPPTLSSLKPVLMTSHFPTTVKLEMPLLSKSILCSITSHCNMMQPLSLLLHLSLSMAQLFELLQQQRILLNFPQLVLPFTSPDGEILKPVDLHPINSSLLVSLLSTLPLVVKPSLSHKTFKFVLEELLDKILAKETVVVLSSLLQIHRTPLMQQSLVLFLLEETNVQSMNLEFILMFRALQMPSFKASSHNLPLVFHLQQLLPHHQV